MLNKLEEKIKIKFLNKKLLEQAFIHRSFINENNNKNLHHNERLEFLGDAVLELATTKFLYQKFPNSNEGELTAYRSALVNTESLSKKAQELKMGDFLKLSKGEKACLKGRGHILANTFEAFIGALYLDQSFEKANQFLEDFLFDYIEEILEKKLYQDSKSYFQEMAQEKVNFTPEYKLIKHSGPDHDRKFVMGVYLEKELISTGKGSSKQKAEVDAAKNALEEKKW